jgi:SAM-dependent methyltransferase
MKDIFTEIYERMVWQGVESVSGPGSSLEQTRELRERLPELFRRYKVSIVLDIPCGDLNWMQFVDLSEVKYIGADIVEELIEKNRKKFKMSFLCLDISTDPLPKVDLILCTDCLVHFSYLDVVSTLGNIARSGSKYLLTTTFPNRTKNVDIETGKWHPYNLTKKPFNLPKPLFLLNEKCTQGNGMYADKSLGLWRIEDIVYNSSF